MQDDIAVPLKCIVDISDLYKYHCSEFAINTAAEYLGGLNKLVEISCHIATLELTNPHYRSSNILSRYIDDTMLNARTIRMVTNVVNGLSAVLKTNFILMLTRPHTLPYLNYVQVMDAVTHTPTTLYNNIPVETTLTLSTMLYWSKGNSHGIR